MFVGKDQSIMAALVLQHPGLVQVITANRSIRDHWFTLLFTFTPSSNDPLPYFSICIPLYNGIEFLPETIASIKNQSFQEYEVLIGVNGHPANSEVYRTAKELENTKIKVFDMPTIQGKPATLNALVAKAKAKWIALCDADDLWDTQKLEIQKQCIDHFQVYDVIGTQCEYFGEMTGSPSIPTGDITQEDFWKANPLLHSSVILKKEFARWNPENRILEDYELWLRLRYQKQCKFLNVPYPLMKHRIHKTSYFNNQNANAVPDLLKNLRSEIEKT